jgi:hypothetical protein
MDDNLFVNVKTCTSLRIMMSHLVSITWFQEMDLLHGDKLQYLIQ